MTKIAALLLLALTAFGVTAQPAMAMWPTQHVCNVAPCGAGVWQPHHHR